MEFKLEKKNHLKFIEAKNWENMQFDAAAVIYIPKKVLNSDSL